jgi:hypothetical protein
MKTKTFVAVALLNLLWLGAPLCSIGAEKAEDATRARWALYEPAFKAFEEEDRRNPPSKGGILFVGSSIFRQWTTVAEQMKPLAVRARRTNWRVSINSCRATRPG